MHQKKSSAPLPPRKKPTHSPNQKPTQQLVLLCLNQASIPFAVIGSNQLIEVKGKKIRGRLYPWGVVEVENPEHNDFLKLRTMLVWVMQKSLQPGDVTLLEWLENYMNMNYLMPW